MVKRDPLENEIKKKIVDDFKSRGQYGRRIEDAYYVGFPDLVLAIEGHPVFFTEAKRVPHQSFGPSSRQFIELDRLAITKHSFPTILGWKNDVHYLCRYKEHATLSECVAQQPGEHIVDLFKRYYNERQ